MSKKILIIGASSAIGLETIRQISNTDAIIIAHYHSRKDKLDLLQRETKARIIPVQADLSTKEGTQSLIDVTTSEYGYPGNIVFLAAPHFTLTRFKDLTWNDFNGQLEMLHSAQLILQAFLPKMAGDKYGRVVFMLTSYTMGIPPASMAHYVTSKYAMLGLMKSLAAEYSSKKICINAVSPSMIETEFLSQIPDKLVEFTAQQHPQKRNGVPADVVPVIKFLLSDEAGYITGTNIPVTGGA